MRRAGLLSAVAVVSLLLVATAAAPAEASSFTTLPSGSTGLPRSDFDCASQVGAGSFEPRLNNYPANTTIPSGPVHWSSDPGNTYWTKWIAKRDHVTGNFTGTTDQIFTWAACKWGVDENLLRAVAAQESWWNMSSLGDNCGVPGEGSYGIMQVKNAYCDGTPAWGGYPDTANDTALNVDFYGARLRSCYDGDFYDGGSWLYGGQTIQQVIAANGEDYALWGCVGSWYSGNWYDAAAQNYINVVKLYLADQTWLGFSTTGTAGDITPPSTPTGLQASDGGGQLTLSWQPSSDDQGVAGYRIYRDGSLVATTPGTSYTATGLVSGNTYSFAVAAVDQAGNQSPHTPPITASAPAADTTPPTVSLTSPRDGTLVSGTVPLTADARDDGAVDHVDFLVDGNVVGTSTSAPYTFAWTSTSVGDGTHTIAARAVDLAQNAATSTSVSIVVTNNNLLPNPSLESVSGSTPVCWLLGGYGINTFTWTGTADAHTGNNAENLTITDWTSGDRKLVSAHDGGACAPAASPDHSYTVTAWYKVPSGETGNPRFYAYYRDVTGLWVYWTQSANFVSSPSWTEATWTTPPVPAGATNVSVGMGLHDVGSVTIDDFGLFATG